MPIQRYTVRPVRVIYICDEPGCGEQQIATDGFQNAIGTIWRHRCKNGHILDNVNYGVKYPRIEYETEPIHG